MIITKLLISLQLLSKIYAKQIFSNSYKNLRYDNKRDGISTSNRWN